VFPFPTLLLLTVIQFNYSNHHGTKKTQSTENIFKNNQSKKQKKKELGF